MTVFVVERYLAGWPVWEVRALVERVRGASEVMAGHGVHHLRSVIVAADETCLCLFEAADAEAVDRANRAAGLPVDRVVAGELAPASAHLDVGDPTGYPAVDDAAPTGTPTASASAGGPTRRSDATARLTPT